MSIKKKNKTYKDKKNSEQIQERVKNFEQEALFVQIADKCFKQNNNQPIEYKHFCNQVTAISEDINYDYESLWLNITGDLLKPVQLTKMENEFRPYLKSYRAMPISVCYTKSGITIEENYKHSVQRHEQSFKNIYKQSKDWGLMINKMAGDFKKLDKHLDAANMQTTELKKERETVAEIVKVFQNE